MHKTVCTKEQLERDNVRLLQLVVKLSNQSATAEEKEEIEELKFRLKLQPKGERKRKNSGGQMTAAKKKKSVTDSDDSDSESIAGTDADSDDESEVAEEPVRYAKAKATSSKKKAPTTHAKKKPASVPKNKSGKPRKTTARAAMKQRAAEAKERENRSKMAAVQRRAKEEKKKAAKEKKAVEAVNARGRADASAALLDLSTAYLEPSTAQLGTSTASVASPVKMTSKSEFTSPTKSSHSGSAVDAEVVNDAEGTTPTDDVDIKYDANGNMDVDQTLDTALNSAKKVDNTKGLLDSADNPAVIDVEAEEIEDDSKIITKILSQNFIKGANNWREYWVTVQYKNKDKGPVELATVKHDYPDVVRRYLGQKKNKHKGILREWMMPPDTNVLPNDQIVWVKDGKPPVGDSGWTFEVLWDTGLVQKGVSEDVIAKQCCDQVWYAWLRENPAYGEAKKRMEPEP